MIPPPGSTNACELDHSSSFSVYDPAHAGGSSVTLAMASATSTCVYLSVYGRDDRKEFWGNRGSSRQPGTLWPQTLPRFSIMKPPTQKTALRYAILLHETSPSMNRPTHWDLLLEDSDHPLLATWALPTQPQIGCEMPCEQLPRHRQHYLDYEGPISGDRGSVTQWDGGGVLWLLDAEDHVRVQLTAGRMVGIVDLTQDATGWHFRHQVID